MTKLKFNYPEIQRDVIPSLTDTIIQLDAAIKQASNMVVPSSFRYVSILNNLPTSLRNTRNKLEDVKEWLIVSNKEYDSAVTEIESAIYGIDDITINRRNKIVR